MINNANIRNCTIPFPAIGGFNHSPFLDMVRTSLIHQQWSGQTVKEIAESSVDNPFNIRIGLPHTDEQLKNDRVFFITKYLSYNPITKQIENRDLIPLRNMTKVYIGQTTQEQDYKDYSLFVDGTIVANDLYIKKFESIKDKSMGELIIGLMEKVSKLQAKVNELTAIVHKNTTIYNQ